LQSYSPAQLAGLLKYMSPEEQAEAAHLIEDDLCRQWVVSHDRGPMYWLRHRTRTFNHHWQQQGLPAEAPFPYKPFRDRVIDLDALPFPHEFTTLDPPDYLDVLMGFMLFTKDIGPADELWVPKTRTMITSWLAVGRISWQCQFYPQIEWIGQSESDEKAQGNIKYANALYANQEQWQKDLHPLKSGVDGTMHKIEWANGSAFRAVASGVRKLASSHPYGYFNDETAHQSGAEATINIAKPAVKQVICVSSVAPGYFWNEVSQAV